MLLRGSSRALASVAAAVLLVFAAVPPTAAAALWPAQDAGLPVAAIESADPSAAPLLIQGLVKDPNGFLLPDIPVQASSGETTYSGATDGYGSYAIAVPPGSYTLHFGGLAGQFAAGYYAQGQPGSFVYVARLASPVAVTAASRTGIDVTLPAVLHLGGLVLSGSGAALSGIVATATSADLTVSATTGVQGMYSMEVIPGSYVVSFTDPHGLYLFGYWTVAGYSATTHDPVIIASGDVPCIDVVLPSAPHIAGTVQDSRGAGIGGISLVLTGPAPATGTSAADGTFRITITAAGTYYLRYHDPAGTYLDGYYGSSGFTTDPAKAAPIVVGASEVTGIDAALPVRTGIPSAPTGVTAAAQVGAALVTWKASSGNGHAITGYTVTSSPDGKTCTTTGVLSCTVSGLANGGTYSFTVTATNGVGISPPSSPSNEVELPDVPSKPGGLVAVAGQFGDVKISWITPLANGSPITGYTVTATAGGSNCTVVETKCTIGGLTQGQAYQFIVVATNGVGNSEPSRPSAAVTATWSAPSSTYHGVSPARILDTRPTGSGHTNIGLTGKFTAGVVRMFSVAGAHYVGGGGAVPVPFGSTAVTGNLTITGQTAGGLIALGPTVTPGGATSTLNFVLGENRANNVTVGLGPAGTLSAVFRSSTPGATVDIIFDVTGYFSPDDTGATYHPVSPGRVLDTRPTSGGVTHIGLTGKFKTKQVRTVAVAGVKALGWASALVPADAMAITANVTVTNATSDGYVALGPTMTATPKTSTVNTLKGRNTANGVTVTLKSGKIQAVWIGASSSTADVIIDVTGYFTADNSGLRFVPVAPYRVLDSLVGVGLSGPFASSSPQSLTIGGTNGSHGVPAGAAGIAGNLTLVGPSSNGYAFVAPAIAGAPSSSTVNSTTGVAAANGFSVPLDADGLLALVWVGTVTSTAQLQLDVTGYWTA